ncbi:MULTISPECIES: flagellar basal body rod protein FlgC [unclassified Acidocella]|uniref:flagellar basal body rod protein FlgC n=1 Tax=unclassified Acidocella TaxID=2648610 RepID=UPI00028C3DCF|nr:MULTISPECIES: flagellar basal body rod protein FlgC [unclassified Acidocella]EKM98279.1 flagellar basal body rod protein FlgC [Acidocella sp. MX-AZ02]WBO59335.1 flagellar basal body rod protein FlgC [Acidocella sp. MX-AZ03]
MTGIFSIVGSALDAQNLRMSAVASNLANADTATAPGAQPYRAEEPVFEAAPVVDAGSGAALGVSVLGVDHSAAAPHQTYDPSSPYANAQGYVTGSNVDRAQEMVNMIDSSNSYSASVAVLEQASRIDQQMIQSFQVS